MRMVMDTAWSKCTCCNRCGSYCPFGIDMGKENSWPSRLCIIRMPERRPICPLPFWERTLFHATASYYVPNVHATAASCRTNIPPNTAFRGFGAPQAMFVFEAAIREASRISGICVETLQRKNLLKTGDCFAYGMAAENARAQRCWDKAYEHYDLQKRMRSIDDAQRKERNSSGQVSRYGRGYALMPVCFGISFTTIFLNQARAHIHVYTDGSVGVSTGAVEMGQGGKPQNPRNRRQQPGDHS